MNNLDKRILEITKVYDNNGETYDRYTVFTPDGAVYGMSEGGEGFNQYIGDYTEVEMGEHLGTKLDSVPESIKTAVLNRMVDSQFVDLFQYYELMPENVSATFNMYYEMNDNEWSYDSLSKLQSELKELGYTFDYGLDAEPYGLRPIELSLNQLKDFEEYENGGSVSESEQSVEFEYKGKNHKFSFVPDEPDMWTSFESHGLVFDVHYDEGYNEIVVYEVIDNEAQLEKSVYNKRIMRKGGSVYNKGRSWHLDRQKHNKSESWEKPMRKRKKRYATGGGLDKFMIGDLVFAKDEGMNGLVGLVISDVRKNEDGVMEYDILYRGYSGDIIPTAENDLVDIRQGYMDIAQNKSDISSYTSIAEKRGITINPVYQQVIDEEYEYKNGGGVKYPTELKVGSVLEGVGFPMLKGIDGGNYYTIVEMDNYSATLVKSDKNGNKKGSKKVRHYLSSIEGGIKTASKGDENGILVVKYANGGGVDSYNLDNEINQLYKKSGFINSDFNWKLKLLEMLQDQSIEAYNIYQKLSKEQKEQVLQEQYEVDNDMGSDGDGKIKTTKENLKILLEDAKNGKKYAKGGGVGKMYLISYIDENGYEVKKKVSVDELKLLTPIVNYTIIKEYAKGGNINSGREAMFKSQEPHEQRYKRKREWKEYKKEGWFGDWFRDGGGVGEIDMNDIEKQANFYTDESRWTTKPTIEKFDKEIMEYQDLKLQLDNNQIRPSKIIGTGFKPQYARPLAYKWINERILVAKRAIEILIERQKQSKEGDISNLQKKIDYINKNYDGVTASKTYSDNRIQVVSPYFNTLNEIKRKEFEGSGLMERYGNTSSYVLYSNQTYEMGGGMDDYTKSLGMVRVKFADPKYNYETNVSGNITEEKARNYFVGKMFDVGTYPNENMQKVIDIDFYPKGTYANGGGISDILYTDSFELDKEKLAKAKYHIAYNRGIYTVIDNKTKNPITSFPTQASAVNYIKTNFGITMANGGGIGNEEEMVKSNLYNGEISCEKLTEIIGCKPNYPYQIVGAIKLEKCYLRPYYKLV
jgi:hypothetical protein